MKLLKYLIIAAIVAAFAFGIVSVTRTKDGISINYNQEKMDETLDKAQHKVKDLTSQPQQIN